MPKVLPDDVRERIVEAAERRIWRCGFTETKISEIAADVGIGKGSIYLFFENKDDLGLAVVVRHKDRVLAEQRAVAQDEGLSHEAKVRRILKVPICMAHDRSRRYPHARQMILNIYTHVPEKWYALRQDGIALLKDVLEDGRRAGHFRFEDARATADAMKDLTAGFLPPFWWTGEAVDLEARVDAVIDLGLRGLRCA